MAETGAIDRRYLEYFQDDPRATVVSVSLLRRTHTDDGARIARAREQLELGRQGLIPKRRPLSAIQNRDGTYAVIDGNSTLSVVEAAGLTHVPVIVT